MTVGQAEGIIDDTCHVLMKFAYTCRWVSQLIEAIFGHHYKRKSLLIKVHVPMLDSYNKL